MLGQRDLVTLAKDTKSPFAPKSDEVAIRKQGEKDAAFGECTVNYLQAKLNKRDCLCIQVVHPVPRSNFLFHMAKIFIDNEWQIPVRYEAYDWPRASGGDPELIEEYTYLKLKLHRGFTNDDFSTQNSAYHFQ